MAEFTVRGPFEVPFKTTRTGAKRLRYAEFWKQTDEVAKFKDDYGVYVFAVKAGKGYTPVYVGKATKSFSQECFNPTNKRKCSDALMEYKKGTPVIFFVQHPKQKGKTNEKEIGQIESFLIQLAAQKNPHLKNVQKTKGPNWSIKGVIRASQGPPTESEREFKKAIGLKGSPDQK